MGEVLLFQVRPVRVTKVDGWQTKKNSHQSTNGDIGKKKHAPSCKPEEQFQAERTKIKCTADGLKESIEWQDRRYKAKIRQEKINENILKVISTASTNSLGRKTIYRATTQQLHWLKENAAQLAIDTRQYQLRYSNLEVKVDNLENGHRHHLQNRCSRQCPYGCDRQSATVVIVVAAYVFSIAAKSEPGL